MVGWLEVMLNGSSCAGCGMRGWSPCPGCVVALVPLPRIHVEGATTAHALFRHEGVGRQMVHALKFGGDRLIARWLGASLAHSVDDVGPVDLVTWMPTTRDRLAMRGYDQAQRLAVAAARRLSVPVRRLLVRRSGVQTGLGRSARLCGPRFDAARPLRGDRVLVIDDVVTTGGTATAAVTALGLAGAAEIHARFCSGAPPHSAGVVRSQPRRA